MIKLNCQINSISQISSYSLNSILSYLKIDVILSFFIGHLALKNIVSLLIVFYITGCITMGDKNQPDRSDNYYFANPEESIPIISELLENENFRILARYYDLSDSGVPLSDLESGDFFIRSNRITVGRFYRIKYLKIILNLRCLIP
jgi:hypothetical protein